MMANDSGIFAQYSEEITRHLIFSVEGGVLFVCNGLLFATILRHEALRDVNSYSVIAVLALADALSGLATCISGFIRNYLRFTGQASYPVSRRFCMFMPHNFIWNIFDVLQAFMLLAVSIDRTLVVALPLKYINWGTKYFYALVTPICIGTIVQALFFMNSSYGHTEPDQIIMCYMANAFIREYHAVRKTVRLAAAFSSMALYVAIVFIYRKRMAAALEGSIQVEQQMKRKLDFERRLTISTAISCFATFIFYGIPQVMSIFALYIPSVKEAFIMFNGWAWIVANLNPLLNLFIYYARGKEIRAGLKALLKNKTLAPVLESWPQQQRTNRVKPANN